MMDLDSNTRAEVWKYFCSEHVNDSKEVIAAKMEGFNSGNHDEK